MKKLSNNERKKGDKTKMEYKRDFQDAGEATFSVEV